MNLSLDMYQTRVYINLYCLCSRFLNVFICVSGWWFHIFFIFHNIWDNPYHWLILFRGVETTNQVLCVNTLYIHLQYWSGVDRVTHSSRPSGKQGTCWTPMVNHPVTLLEWLFYGDTSIYIHIYYIYMHVYIYICICIYIYIYMATNGNQRYTSQDCWETLRISPAWISLPSLQMLSSRCSL